MTMRNAMRAIPFRILVTGARGKSSLTRLLHAAFRAAGKTARARITGVLPREIGPNGAERGIKRSSPVHIREIRWWLEQIPSETEALVVENSAVSPALQHVAPAILIPTLTVWTTLRADHTESWGPGLEGAARALVRGVPAGGIVAAGNGVSHPLLADLFRQNGNTVHYDHSPAGCPHREANESLARLAVSLCLPDADMDAVRAGMSALPPDVADFRVIRSRDDCLAVAFSANDTESTDRLFRETGWDAADTTLLYHHREDRGARLSAFLPWIASRRWKETVFSRAGTRSPFFPTSAIRWNDSLNSPESFRNWWSGKGRVFACGNVAGWPLAFLQKETAP